MGGIWKTEKEDLTQMPERFRREWDEIRLCAALIRQGQARIVVGTRADGSTYRYTKVKGKNGTK